MPDYFKFNDSIFFTNFFDLISIDELRSLYKIDRESFHTVLIEMKMRGFEFELDGNLPSIFKKQSTPKHLIMPLYPEDDSFLKIDFESLGLGSFIYKFGIQKNAFFDNLPLEGLLELNPSLNLNQLAESFLKNGFKIVPIIDENTSQLSIEQSDNTSYDLSILEIKDHIKCSIDYPLKLDKPLIFSGSIKPQLSYLSYSDINYLLSMSDLDQEKYKEIQRNLKITENSEYISVHDSIFLLLNSMSEFERSNYIREHFPFYLHDQKFMKDIMHLDISSPTYLKIRDNNIRMLEEQDLFSQFQNIWGKIYDEKDEDILNKRLVKGMTLEAIANDYSLTRERIRQIVSKLTKNLSLGLSKTRFLPRFKTLLRKRKFYTKDYLLNYLSETQFQSLVEVIENYDPSLDYQSSFEMFTMVRTLQEDYIFSEYFSNEKLISNQYIKKIKENIYHETGIKLEVAQIKQLLKSYGYQEQLELWKRRGVTYGDVYDYIIQNYFRGHYHSLDDFAEFSRIYNQIYEKKELIPRNIYARLQDHPMYLLVESNTFIHYKLCWKNEELEKQIELVDNYAKIFLRNHEILDFQADFKLHEDEYIKQGIMTPLHAYSILKKFKSDEYKFSPGNVLAVSFSADNHITRSERLEKFIKDHGPVIDKKDLDAALKWERYTIDQAINKSPFLIGWGHGKVRYIDPELLKSHEEDIERLTAYVKKLLIDHKAHAIEPIYTETLFNGFNNLYHTLSIQSSEQLLAFLSSVKGDTFRTRGKFIVLKEYSDEIELDELVMQEVPNYFTRDEFHNIMIEEYNYASSTVYQYLDYKYRNNQVFQIDLNLFCKKEEFTLTLSDQKDILDWIKTQSDGEDLIVLNNIFINSQALPKLQFKKPVEYNVEILATVLELGGYHNLYRNNNLLFKPYIYTNNKAWATLEDMIYDLTKSKGIYHYDDLYDFMQKLFKFNSELNIDSMIRDFDGNKISVNWQTLDIDMEREL